MNLHKHEPFELGGALTAYTGDNADATPVAKLFTDLVGTEGNPYSRENAFGHFTGSALVVSADGRRTLLTHHRKLGLWLQPGGHADGDRDLRRVALREAREETGLVGLSIESAIFDLDRHWIPARPGEPAHWHYDVRFLVRVGSDERYTVTPESHALRWWPIETVVATDEFDPSLRRMAWRWLERRRAATGAR